MSMDRWTARNSAGTHLYWLVLGLSPQFVKPYIKSSKNDQNDAEAICEAVSQPSMRFVPLKSTWQQDLQMLHRIRELAVKDRTAKANQARGLLAEYGIVIPRGITRLKKEMPRIAFFAPFRPPNSET